MGWDEQNLYLVAKVTDNRIVQAWQGAELWQGDHLEIWVDTDFMGDASETKINADDFQIGISPGDFQNIKPEIYCWYPKAKEGKIESGEIASSLIADGYILEATIPFKFLDITPESEKLIGFCMLVSDTDDGKYPQKCMLSSSENYKYANPITFNRLHFLRWGILR